MNRNSGRDCPGGWLEMAPWQGIRFVHEPAVMARRKCIVSRIRLDPGDIPIEEAIAAMPEEYAAAASAPSSSATACSSCSTPGLLMRE